MVEKDKDFGMQKFLHSISDAFSSEVKFLFSQGLHKIQETIYLTEKKLIQHLYAALILLAGTLFLAVGIALFLAQTLQLGMGAGFLIVGIILMIIALILKRYITQTMYLK